MGEGKEHKFKCVVKRIFKRLHNRNNIETDKDLKVTLNKETIAKIPFKGRQEALDFFDEKFKEYEDSKSIEGKPHVIQFWGGTGIGKSALLNEIINKNLVQNKIRYFKFDFNLQSSDIVQIISTMAKGLTSDCGFSFPLTALALNRIANESNFTEPLTKKNIGETISDNFVLNGVIATVKALTGLGNLIEWCMDVFSNLEESYENEINRIYGTLDKHTGFAKKIIETIDELDPRQIRKGLTRFFSIDLNVNIQKEKKPFVFFLDTYEFYLGKVGASLFFDSWISSEDGLINKNPLVFWVISSRNRLPGKEQAEYRKNWELLIGDDRHILLGNLSEYDARSYLGDFILYNQELINSLLERLKEKYLEDSAYELRELAGNIIDEQDNRDETFSTLKWADENVSGSYGILDKVERLESALDSLYEYCIKNNQEKSFLDIIARQKEDLTCGCYYKPLYLECYHSAYQLEHDKIYEIPFDEVIDRYLEAVEDPELRDLIRFFSYFDDGWTDEMLEVIKWDLPNCFSTSRYSQLLSNYGYLIVTLSPNNRHLIDSGLRSQIIAEEKKRNEKYYLSQQKYILNLKAKYFQKKIEEGNNSIEYFMELGSILIKAESLSYSIFRNNFEEKIYNFINSDNFEDADALLSVFEKSDSYKSKKDFSLYLSILSLRAYLDLKGKKIPSQRLNLSKSDKAEFNKISGYSKYYYYISLALEYVTKGEYGKALSVYDDGDLPLMSLSSILFGENSLKSSNLIYDKAYVLYLMGKYSEALREAEKCMKIRMLFLGDVDYSVMEVRYFLAKISIALGEYDNAEKYLDLCEEYLRKVNDSPNFSLYDTLMGLRICFLFAEISLDKYEFSDAITIDSKIYDELNKKLGGDHPDTLSVLERIAYIHLKKGDYSVAEEQFKECIEKRKEANFNEFENFTARLSLIFCFIDNPENKEKKRKWTIVDEKIEECNLIKKQCTQIFSEDHPIADIASFTIGYCYFFADDYSKAEEVFCELSEHRRVVYGERHLLTLESLRMYGKCLVCEECYEKAIDIYRRVYSGAKEILGRTNHKTWEDGFQLGELLEHSSFENRISEIISVFEELYNCIQKEERSFYHKILEKLIDTYEKEGKIEKAYHYTVEMVDSFSKEDNARFEYISKKAAFENKLNKEDEAVETIFVILEGDCLNSGFYKKGKDLLSEIRRKQKDPNKALDICRRCILLDNYTGKSELILGECVVYIDKIVNFEKAVSWFDEFIQIVEKQLEDAILSIKLKFLKICIFEKFNKLEQAKNIYKKSYEKIKNEESPYFAFSFMLYEHLGNLLLHQGEYVEALACYNEVFNKKREYLNNDREFIARRSNYNLFSSILFCLFKLKGIEYCKDILNDTFYGLYKSNLESMKFFELAEYTLYRTSLNKEGNLNKDDIVDCAFANFIYREYVSALRTYLIDSGLKYYNRPVVDYFDLLLMFDYEGVYTDLKNTLKECVSFVKFFKDQKDGKAIDNRHKNFIEQNKFKKYFEFCKDSYELNKSLAIDLYVYGYELDIIHRQDLINYIKDNHGLDGFLRLELKLCSKDKENNLYAKEIRNIIDELSEEEFEPVKVKYCELYPVSVSDGKDADFNIKRGLRHKSIDEILICLTAFTNTAYVFKYKADIAEKDLNSIRKEYHASDICADNSSLDYIDFLGFLFSFEFSITKKDSIVDFLLFCRGNRLHTASRIFIERNYSKIDFTNDKHQNKMIAFLIAGLNDDAVNICSKIDDFELEVLLKNPVYYKNRTYLDYLEICHEALVDRYGVTTNSLEIEREVQRQKQINVKTQHKYPCSKEDEFLLWLYETVGLPQLVELLGIEDVLIERIKKEKNHLIMNLLFALYDGDSRDNCGSRHDIQEAEAEQLDDEPCESDALYDDGDDYDDYNQHCDADLLKYKQQDGAVAISNNLDEQKNKKIIESCFSDKIKQYHEQYMLLYKDSINEEVLKYRFENKWYNANVLKEFFSCGSLPGALSEIHVYLKKKYREDEIKKDVLDVFYEHCYKFFLKGKNIKNDLINNVLDFKIKELVENQKDDDLKVLLAILKEKRVDINEFCFQTLFSYYCKRGDIEKALDVLDLKKSFFATISFRDSYDMWNSILPESGRKNDILVSAIQRFRNNATCKELLKIMIEKEYDRNLKIIAPDLAEILNTYYWATLRGNAVEKEECMIRASLNPGMHDFYDDVYIEVGNYVIDKAIFDTILSGFNDYDDCQIQNNWEYDVDEEKNVFAELIEFTSAYEEIELIDYEVLEEPNNFEYVYNKKRHEICSCSEPYKLQEEKKVDEYFSDEAYFEIADSVDDEDFEKIQEREMQIINEEIHSGDFTDDNIPFDYDDYLDENF